MAENIRMDSHKLMYHPVEVGKWLDGQDIYPIEIEISPSGACNHRCIFCAVDYIGYHPYFLDKDVIVREISQMHQKGLKSVICSGEGEPLLNKDMPDIANRIKSLGVDVAMSTNGILFTKEVASECLASFSWVRYSVAGMEESSYNKIQRGRPGDLERLKQNLYDIVRLKKERGISTTLGVQCILLNENETQVLDMAKQLREIGVDYFTIKPYSKHLYSKNDIKIDYGKYLFLEQQLRELETEHFRIYFRVSAMKKVHTAKEYDICYGLPFMTHIDASGNVWPCVAHVGKKEFKYGNIYEEPLLEIWEGEKRRNVIEALNKCDINQTCREACRLDEINKYLYELKHPGGHVNFI